MLFLRHIKMILKLFILLLTSDVNLKKWWFNILYKKCYKNFDLLYLKFWSSIFNFAKIFFYGKNGIIYPSYLNSVFLSQIKSENRLIAKVMVCSWFF